MIGNIDAVIEVLGGREVLGRVLRDENELRAMIRAGLPVPSIDAVSQAIGVTDAELARPLGLSPASVRDRHRRWRLTPLTSDRLLRVAAIVALSTTTFGDAGGATRWLVSPNPALDGETPLGVCAADHFGAKRKADRWVRGAIAAGRAAVLRAGRLLRA